MVIVSSIVSVLSSNRKQQNCHCQSRLGALNYVLLDDPKLQETQERVKNRGDSAYHKAHSSGCYIVDLTKLNTQTGCSGDSFMIFVEEAAKVE
jgi:hypothetical protein